MKFTFMLAVVVFAALSKCADATVISEWQVNLTRGTTTTTFVRLYNASTKEAAERACAEGVPRSNSTPVTYTCAAARQVFVVTPDPVVCAPAPPPRTGLACPSGTVGTWSQTATVGPPPACTVTWSPTIPPATSCAPVQTNSLLLSWTPPSTNSDGSSLTNLAGYFVRCGNTPTAPVRPIMITVPSATSWRVTDLSAGTWYCAVWAYNSEGVESGPSNFKTGIIQ